MPIVNPLQTAYEQQQRGEISLDEFIAVAYPTVARLVPLQLSATLRSNADDLIQTIMVELWQRLPKNATNIRAWIRALVWHRCVDYARHRVTILDQQPDDSRPEQPSDDGGDLPMPSTLTKAERKLAYLLSDGYTEREIADLEKKGKTTVHRSIEALRKKYAA